MWDNAVSQARKTLEAICFEICEEEALAGKRPVSSLSLDEMLATIERSSLDIPKSLPKVMRSLQAFGNLATHDQGESSTINENICISCLSMLDDLCNWFEGQYLKDLKSNHNSDSYPKGEFNAQPSPSDSYENQMRENFDNDKHEPILNPIENINLTEKKSEIKRVKRSKRTDRLDQFLQSIRGVDRGLECPLIQLFEKVENLDLVLDWGSGSRSVKTPFKIRFPHEENRGGFNRAFNFGNIKSDGTFFNSSCEREVGRNYLTHLSSLIPQTTTRFMENEFKSTIIQNNGKPVPLVWMLDRQDEWIELIKMFLPYLNSQKVT